MSALQNIVKTLLKLLGSYLFVLFAAGVVAVPVYHLLHPIIGHDFHRYVDRMRYVGLLMLLPLWWKWAGVNWKGLGWKKWDSSLQFVLWGAMSVIAVGLVAAIYASDGIILHASDREVILPSAWEFLGLVATGLGVGLVVSLIEEIVFRGVMMRFCVKGCGVRVGIWISALVFAWMHGRPEMNWVTSTIDLGDGLALASAYITQMPANMTFVELVNLAMLGGVLGTLYYKSRSIWVPVAMHMGIVAAVVFVDEVVMGFGLAPVKEALTEIPVTTIMLGAWVVAVAVWPDPVADAAFDSAAEKSA